jgi:hypothetical protein
MGSISLQEHPAFLSETILIPSIVGLFMVGHDVIEMPIEAVPSLRIG